MKPRSASAASASITCAATSPTASPHSPRAPISSPSPSASALPTSTQRSPPTPPLVLDIRNPREWSAKHIPGSVNIPLNHLQERLAEIPRDRRIAVHCAGGYRSSAAASILHQHGINNLIEMTGGLAAWEAAKLPLVSET